jgi:pimeloyl-ACP methyl ester carboxylesterase
MHRGALVALAFSIVLGGLIGAGKRRLIELHETLPNPRSLSTIAAPAGGGPLAEALLPSTPYMYSGAAATAGGPVRPLCFQLWGRPSANVVVYFAGLVGSRLEHFGAPSSEHFVLTIDRPGLGCSPAWEEGASPSAGARRTTRYTDVADVVLGLLRTLGVDGFSTVGWSSGGPFALALAHQAGHAPVSGTPRLLRTSTVASDPHWASMSALELVRAPLSGLLVCAVRCLPRRVVGFAAGRIVEALAGIELGVATRWGADRERQRGAPSRFIINLAEGLRQRGASELAVAGEMALERAREWGFQFDDLVRAESPAHAAPVLVLHSPADRAVPYAAALQLKSRLRGATLYRMPPYATGTAEGEGHSIMERHWELIVGAAAVEGGDINGIDPQLRADMEVPVVKRSWWSYI